MARPVPGKMGYPEEGWKKSPLSRKFHVYVVHVHCSRLKSGKKNDWLVVLTPTPLKNDGVKVSWDLSSQDMESHSKFHGSIIDYYIP